jgi:6-pyruvoyltetrahydropterin/6-carboxytetrahydropterin synthase
MHPEPLHYELSQRFYFEAAHTLQRAHGAASSRRVHGHTYHAEVTVGGLPDPATGMVVDLAVLRAAIDEVRGRLDHHLLDEVEGLGTATLENLCAYLFKALSRPGWRLLQVEVRREASGDRCCLKSSRP